MNAGNDGKRGGTALVMAGGTGGHIFPGLAVADALRDKGWRVHWLGAPGSMEERLVPPRGFAFEAVQFSGVRGKNLQTAVLLPLRLLRAFWQALGVVRRVKPDVIVGLGGYITVPGGLMGVLAGKPLVLHEQNSVAGMANKVLARLATRVFTAYPQVLPQGEWVGNPLRPEFLRQVVPLRRMAGRSGPLKLLVLGGSLGAKGLNDVVPQALALLPHEQRPQVVHQSGAQHIDALRALYAHWGVQGELTPFIEHTAQAMADADLVLCRAGASTVTELAAVGAAAVLVPFPHAVDDHQTQNARFLVDAGAARLVQQRDLTAQVLVEILQNSERTLLIRQAVEAKKMQKTQAVTHLVAACEQLAKVAA
jgi:UDP-N-acetylglucosamine--N-acetylmuramyl-(pentapeptide) pyrophosphoryl-undecaprenol N-acetylglucosamine transferase